MEKRRYKTLEVIRYGIVQKVTGSDPFAAQLEAVLEKDPDFRNIAELGIGTNDRASRPDNILEKEEKQC